MSIKHPIIAITGGAGAGTTTVSHVFSDIFRRENVTASFLQGDSFRRYDRTKMKSMVSAAEKKGTGLSHFGPEANLFDELETQFKAFSETGCCKTRQYVTQDKNCSKNYAIGTFTDWRNTPVDTQLLLYEGLHGGVVAQQWTRRKMSDSHNPWVREERRRGGNSQTALNNGVDVAQYVDLLIGIVPVVNLEWIQKIHRDSQLRGRRPDKVTDTIIHRMQDYIYYIVPQFSYTDINFQRIPIVDTSNPFIARDIPDADESLYVIRFREPQKYQFVPLLQQIPAAYMSRPNTMVIPGGKLQIALALVCTPIVRKLCGIA